MRPCHFFLCRKGVLGMGHLVVFLFHQCVTGNKCKLCSKWHWQVQVKWSVNLMNVLGPDIFFTLWMKGHYVLHRERAHMKVLGWSLVWNELLTKKLPMFMSRLNEIRGGCEKIVPVSELFCSNLKFLGMLDLTALLWGWNVIVNGIRSIFSFSTVWGADCRSIWITR